MASINSGFTPVSSSFPLSAISLMVSSSPFYDEAVNSLVGATNMAYKEFLRSEEGQGFRGEVSANIRHCFWCILLCCWLDQKARATWCVRLVYFALTSEKNIHKRKIGFPPFSRIAHRVFNCDWIIPRR